MARDGDDLQSTHRAFRSTVCDYGGLCPEDLGPNNPAKSAKQQRFMGAELARAERGEPTETGMSRDKLREFARKPRGGY